MKLLLVTFADGDVKTKRALSLKCYQLNDENWLELTLPTGEVEFLTEVTRIRSL